MKTLSTLMFTNSYSDLPASLSTQVTPQPLDTPFLVHFNPLVAEKLELASITALDPSFIGIFSGNATLAGLSPLAMKYCGHQFGQYNPDLGDGRGLLLGEVLTSEGKKWDLHLKGSGKTPIPEWETDVPFYDRLSVNTLQVQPWKDSVLRQPMH